MAVGFLGGLSGKKNTAKGGNAAVPENAPGHPFQGVSPEGMTLNF